MNKIFARVFALLIAFCVAFTAIPMMMGDADIYAAAKKKNNAKKITLRVTDTTRTTVSLKWNKVKGAKGYAVFRNGKPVKHLGKKATKYTDSSLRPDTGYTYQVKSYTKKTKKKNGKKVIRYSYKKKSNKASATTDEEYGYETINQDDPNNQGGSNSQGDPDNPQEPAQPEDKDPLFTESVRKIPDSATFDIKQGSVTYTIKSKYGVNVSVYGTCVVYANTGFAAFASPDKTFTFVDAGTVEIVFESKASKATKRLRLTVTQKEAKYDYRIYRLKGTEIYSEKWSGEGEYYKKYGTGDPDVDGVNYGGPTNLLVITDNPDCKDLHLFDVDKNKSISNSVIAKTTGGNYYDLDYPVKPSELRNAYYADIDNIPDITSDGKHVYIFKVTFSDVKTYNIKIAEGNSLTDDVWKIEVKDPYKAFDKWIADAIDKYYKPGMSAGDNMAAITEGLESEATYNWFAKLDKYTSNTSFYLDSAKYWESYYWDSANTWPMYEIGARLDYKVIGWKEAGHSSVDHACVYGDYSTSPTGRRAYSICPATSTSPDLATYCPQLSMSDFVEIQKN